MKTSNYILIFISLISLSYTSDEIIVSNDPIDETLYFPPIGSDTWKTVSLTDLNWNENNLQQLLDFLEEKKFKKLHCFI